MTDQRPEAVVSLMKTGDREGLSELGKKGAEAKKRNEMFRRERLFAEMREIASQANEDICPVND